MSPRDVAAETSLPEVHIDQADKTHRWRRLLGLKQYFAWVCYSSMGVVMLGFDWSAYPQMLAMPFFAKKYGQWDPAKKLYVVPSSHQAAWNGSSSAAQIVGGFSTGFIIHRFGRRWWLFVLCCIQILSIGLVYASTGWKFMCAGRILQGYTIGALTTFSPVYIAENSIPELRGFFLICFNSFIVLGQFMITLVTRKTIDIHNEWQYKVPILIMFLYPIIVLAGFYWYPESPYFLFSRGKKEEGRKALLRLYGSGDSEIVDKLAIGIQHSIQSSEVLAKAGEGGRFIDVFRGSNWKRASAGILVGAGQQIVGVNFIVGYVPYFLTLSNIPNPFNWNMYLFTVNLVVNIASYWTVETFGRRQFIVWGLALMAIINLIIGALNVEVSKGKLYATIGLLYVWAGIYQGSIGALGYSMASEVATVSLRAYTQAVITFTHNLPGWVFSFSIPYMINPDAGNLGGKVGFIFGSFTVVLFVIAWYICPETKGMTFTELDYLYSQNILPRHFLKVIEQRRAEGIFDEEDEVKGSDEQPSSVHIEEVKT
ncbi:general substrate transporter [Xylogone sp. PMI_703]|nr:general substrate transporter [Xylogone sp. PMI_703]